MEPRGSSSGADLASRVQATGSRYGSPSPSQFSRLSEPAPPPPSTQPHGASLHHVQHHVPRTSTAGQSALQFALSTSKWDAFADAQHAANETNERIRSKINTPTRPRPPEPLEVGSWRPRSVSTAGGAPLYRPASASGGLSGASVAGVGSGSGGSSGVGGAGSGVENAEQLPPEAKEAGSEPLSAEGSSKGQSARPSTEKGGVRRARRPSQPAPTSQPLSQSSTPHQHQHLRYQTLNKHPLMSAPGSQPYTHNMNWDSHFARRAGGWSPPKGISLLSDGLPPPSSSAAAVANALADWQHAKGQDKRPGVATTTVIIRQRREEERKQREAQRKEREGVFNLDPNELLTRLNQRTEQWKQAQEERDLQRQPLSGELEGAEGDPTNAQLRHSWPSGSMDDETGESNVMTQEPSAETGAEADRGSRTRERHTGDRLTGGRERDRRVSASGPSHTGDRVSASGPSHTGDRADRYSGFALLNLEVLRGSNDGPFSGPTLSTHTSTPHGGGSFSPHPRLSGSGPQALQVRLSSTGCGGGMNGGGGGMNGTVTAPGSASTTPRPLVPTSALKRRTSLPGQAVGKGGGGAGAGAGAGAALGAGTRTGAAAGLGAEAQGSGFSPSVQAGLGFGSRLPGRSSSGILQSRPSAPTLSTSGALPYTLALSGGAGADAGGGSVPPSSRPSPTPGAYPPLSPEASGLSMGSGTGALRTSGGSLSAVQLALQSSGAGRQAAIAGVPPISISPAPPPAPSPSPAPHQPLAASAPLPQSPLSRSSSPLPAASARNPPGGPPHNPPGGIGYGFGQGLGTSPVPASPLRLPLTPAALAAVSPLGASLPSSPSKALPPGLPLHPSSPARHRPGAAVTGVVTPASGSPAKSALNPGGAGLSAVREGAGGGRPSSSRGQGQGQGQVPGQGQGQRDYELPPDVKHFMRFYTGGAKTLGLTEELAAEAKQALAKRRNLVTELEDNVEGHGAIVIGDYRGSGTKSVSPPPNASGTSATTTTTAAAAASLFVSPLSQLVETSGDALHQLQAALTAKQAKPDHQGVDPSKVWRFSPAGCEAGGGSYMYVHKTTTAERRRVE